MARKSSKREDSFRRLQSGILEKIKAGHPIQSNSCWHYFWTSNCVEEALIEQIGIFATGAAGTPLFLAKEHVVCRPFIFTLADCLLLELLRHPLSHYLWRSLRAALKYGLYGYSGGGRSG